MIISLCLCVYVSLSPHQWLGGYVFQFALGSHNELGEQFLEDEFPWRRGGYSRHFVPPVGSGDAASTSHYTRREE